MVLSFIINLCKIAKAKTRRRGPTISQKLNCWACGLYETNHAICRQCSKCNHWTITNFSKINWRDRMIEHASDEPEQQQDYRSDY